MAEEKNLPAGMTVVEAVERLEEFKQKIIDERYEELVDEGEIDTTISVEVMESIDIILYYLATFSDPSDET